MFYHVWAWWPFWSSDLQRNDIFILFYLLHLFSISPVVLEKKCFDMYVTDQNEWPWVKDLKVDLTFDPYI